MTAAAILLCLALRPSAASAGGDAPRRISLPSAESLLGQLQASEAAVLAGAGGSLEASAAGAGSGFAERSSPAPVSLGARAASFYAASPAPAGAPRRLSAAAAPPPAVYAAGGEKKEEKGPGWDYDKTMKAGAFGMAGALVGFLLGGPIGAAAGFLAGFFVGALIAKATEGRGC
ncbi:MAG: hypothetical protein HY928_16345 [Elusimicrobia bacterium]|nr:hypothetical protein [Elusimicrobiota bacterium]